MRTALVLLFCLTACSPAAAPPSAPVSSSSHAASVSDTRKLEAEAMAAHPGFARRDGEALVLTRNGKDVARLSDGNSAGCGAMDDCAGWTFRGVDNLQSATGLDPTILVARSDSGDRTRYLLVGGDPDVAWFDGFPAVSPTGQYIVSASASGAMVLTDWATPYPHTMYDFGPDCTFLKWTSDREGQARCTYPGGKATVATLALYDQVWRLGDDQEIDPNAADIQPVEGSHLKLRAQLVKGAPGTGADDSELKTLGFARLE